MSKLLSDYAFVQDHLTRLGDTDDCQCLPVADRWGDDLVEDARYYTSQDGPNEYGLTGLKTSARAVLRKLGA